VGPNNGTLQGGTTFAPGEVGQAFNFNGTSAYVQVADSPNLRFTTAMTIEAWIYPRTSGGPFHEIASKWEGGSNQRSYVFDVFPDGRGEFAVNSDGANSIASAKSLNAIPTNQWSHLAGVYDGTSVKLYLNGVLQSSNSWTNGIFPGTAPLIIGSTLVSGSFFDGLVDELSLYNRALAATEIQAIYNAGSLGKCPPTPPTNCVAPPSGLLSWWQAEGNGNDSVNGNTAVLLNGTSFTNGEVGQGFSFDGVSDEIVVSNSPTINFGTNDFSIEGWIKAFPNSTAFNLNTIIDKRFNQTIGYEFTLESGSLHLRLSSTPGSDGTGGTEGPDLRDGTFHHVAVSVTRSSSTGIVFYVDGAAVGAADPTSQQGSLSNSAVMVIGEHSAGLNTYFDGVIDELSLYGRALSAAEIQSIFSAGSAGKCAVATAPFIVTQPASQTVTAGAVVTFSVGASGSPPLTYQWQFNSNNIAGATGSSYTIASAQSSNAGLYSVAVTNSVGFAISSNASLIVNPGPSALRVGDAGVASGGTVTIPVLLTANGNENALSFSLNFDTNRLTYVRTVLSNSAGAALLVNESQTAAGKLGVALALSAGATFPPGAQELVEVTFTAGLVTNATTTEVSFGDQPVVRQVSDTAGHTEPANYTSGLVSIGAVVWEADVSPRPNGDKAVTVTDWVQVGRFVARLDSPTNAGEFQRADCAPRSTLGDGRLTITDWVQAGRYAAGLDPLTPVGGPNAPSPAAATVVVKPYGPSPLVSRQISATGTNFDQGQTGVVSISLQAQGNENAAGFTLAFDPAVVSYTGASLGSGASGALMNVNTDEASAGRVGFALALGSGASFAAGSDELVKVTFQASVANAGSVSMSFADDPIYREISDPGANVLTANYLGTTITINAVPSLSISQGDQGVTLTWPSWATNFVLQQRDGDISAVDWTNSSATVTTTGNQSSTTVPIEASTRFYRLLKQ
jgi:hypothetical protein